MDKAKTSGSKLPLKPEVNLPEKARSQTPTNKLVASPSPSLGKSPIKTKTTDLKMKSPLKSDNPRNLNQASSSFVQTSSFSRNIIISPEKSEEIPKPQVTDGIPPLDYHPVHNSSPPDPKSSNSTRGRLYVTSELSPKQKTNTITSASYPLVNTPNSNGGNGGNSNLFTLLMILGLYLMAPSLGNGGSIPPSLPGSSLGPPIQPPPMGIVGVWSSFITNLITTLLAIIGNWIRMITKSKIIVDNPNLAVLTTAVVGVYLLRKKGILSILGFLLSLLAGYLYWKLKMSIPAGTMKLLQGGSTEIMLSTEIIVLAIAFTVTLTAACIVGLVISITKKD
jgi:hypothetical protein